MMAMAGLGIALQISADTALSDSSKVFDNRTYLGNTFGLRMDNSLIYSTPNWSGFSAQAMLVMNGQCPPTDPQTPAELRYGTACGSQARW